MDGWGGASHSDTDQNYICSCALAGKTTGAHLFTNFLPDNPRHLVAIQFDDGIVHFDFGEAVSIC